MKIRHRVPTIFNIYMLDVICCALGCVVLLWQVSHQEAEEQTAAAEQARLKHERALEEIASVSSEAGQFKNALAVSRAKAQQLAVDLLQSRDLAAARLQDYQKTRLALDLSEALAKKLRVELADLQETSKKTTVDLQALLAATEQKLRSSEKDVTAQKALTEETLRKLAENLALWREAESRNKKLDQQVADLRGEGREAQAKLTLIDLRNQVLEQQLDRNKKELTDTALRYKDLVATHDAVSKQLVVSAKELRQARATLALLEGDKVKLEGESARLLAKARELQAAAEQRFAGIELKGENVVFLVDMSGSMAMIDSQTPDPDKWPKVCEVVARLMRSLAGLQRFQIILFSDRARYLFGHDGQWLKYDPDSSAQVALDALKRAKPQGETNLHTAFGEAFRFRATGLDTIYVLSDGLPNAGEGLPANAEQMSDSQRSELLSRHLRQKLKTEWNRPQAERGRVRIHTIGFFFESPDVGAFLWALAREHDGSFVGMSKP